MKHISKIQILLLVTLLPSVAFSAADFILAGQTFGGIVNYIRELIYILIPIFYGLALIMFFWGLSKFILNAGNATEVKKGQDYMIWGILALFVLLSVRTLIGYATSELEFGDNPTESGVLLKDR